MNKRVYLSNPISGNPHFKEEFSRLKTAFLDAHESDSDTYDFIDPSHLGEIFHGNHQEYMEICKAMFDTLAPDILYCSSSALDSLGCNREIGWAEAMGIEIEFATDNIKFYTDAVDLFDDPAPEPKRKQGEHRSVKCVCKVCGREFESKSKNAVACSDACRKIRAKDLLKARKEAAVDKPRKTRKAKEQVEIRPSKAFAIEKEARKVGKRYADIQREKTMKLITPITTDTMEV